MGERPKPAGRDPEVIKREAELKRDALHVFRRLKVAESNEEKSELCGEASKLYDSIESRVGSGMASITSGRIVFCNALMVCDGLDQLRSCQECNDAQATGLV